jgi:hypothetical protein
MRRVLRSGKAIFPNPETRKGGKGAGFSERQEVDMNTTCEEEQRKAREAYEALQQFMGISGPHDGNIARQHWQDAEKAFEDCLKSSSVPGDTH